MSPDLWQTACSQLLQPFPTVFAAMSTWNTLQQRSEILRANSILLSKKTLVFKKAVARALVRVKNLLVSLIIYCLSTILFTLPRKWQLESELRCYLLSGSQRTTQSVKTKLSLNTAQPWYLEDPITYSWVFPTYTNILGTIYVWNLCQFLREKSIPIYQRYN